MRYLSILILCFCLMSALPLKAGGDHAGIRVVAFQQHSMTYDIRLSTLPSLEQADLLDSGFMTKNGIISAETNHETGICRVVAKREITMDNLADVVDLHGMSVAKSFDQ